MPAVSDWIFTCILLYILLYLEPANQYRERKSWHKPPWCPLAVQLTEDVQEECAGYGTVEGLIIPQPPKTLPPSEPGRAYIKFASHEEASKAKPVFDGRLFDNIKVTAKLVPDDDFQRASDGEWIHIPMPGGLPAHPGQLAVLRPQAVCIWSCWDEIDTAL